MSQRATVMLFLEDGGASIDRLLRRVVEVTDDLRRLVSFIHERQPEALRVKSTTAKVTRDVPITAIGISRCITADFTVTPCTDLLVEFFKTDAATVLQLADLTKIASGKVLAAARAEYGATQMPTVDAEDVEAQPMVETPAVIDTSIRHIVRDAIFIVAHATSDYGTGVCYARHDAKKNRVEVKVARQNLTSGSTETSTDSDNEESKPVVAPKTIITQWSIGSRNNTQYPWDSAARMEYSNITIVDGELCLILYEPRRRYTIQQQRVYMESHEGHKRRAHLPSAIPVIHARYIQIGNLVVRNHTNEAVIEKLQRYMVTRNINAAVSRVGDCDYIVDFGKESDYTNAYFNPRQIMKLFPRGHLLCRPVIRCVGDAHRPVVTGAMLDARLEKKQTAAKTLAARQEAGEQVKQAKRVKRAKKAKKAKLSKDGEKATVAAVAAVLKKRYRSKKPRVIESDSDSDEEEAKAATSKVPKRKRAKKTAVATKTVHERLSDSDSDDYESATETVVKKRKHKPTKSVAVSVKRRKQTSKKRSRLFLVCVCDFQ